MCVMLERIKGTKNKETLFEGNIFKNVRNFIKLKVKNKEINDRIVRHKSKIK